MLWSLTNTSTIARCAILKSSNRVHSLQKHHLSPPQAPSLLFSRPSHEWIGPRQAKLRVQAKSSTRMGAERNGRRQVYGELGDQRHAVSGNERGELVALAAGAIIGKVGRIDLLLEGGRVTPSWATWRPKLKVRRDERSTPPASVQSPRHHGTRQPREFLRASAILPWEVSRRGPSGFAESR